MCTHTYIHMDTHGVYDTRVFHSCTCCCSPLSFPACGLSWWQSHVPDVCRLRKNPAQYQKEYGLLQVCSA